MSQAGKKGDIKKCLQGEKEKREKERSTSRNFYRRRGVLILARNYASEITFSRLSMIAHSEEFTLGHSRERMRWGGGKGEGDTQRVGKPENCNGRECRTGKLMFLSPSIPLYLSHLDSRERPSSLDRFVAEWIQRDRRVRQERQRQSLRERDGTELYCPSNRTSSFGIFLSPSPPPLPPESMGKFTWDLRKFVPD